MKKIQKIAFVALMNLLATISYGQVLTDNPCNVGSQTGSQWPLDGTCYNVTTAGFSPLFNTGTCNSSGVNDGWAWFVGDGNDITITFNPGNAFDPVMHLFSATAPCSVLELACSDNCCNNANEVITLTPSVLGQVYFIRLQDWNSNATMTGCLSVATAGPPVGTADYTHPTASIQNEFVGSCLVATCTGTYADDGDTGGNYSNGVNSIYRVFCPDAALNCVTITFNSFDVEASGTCAFDYLTVGNGPTQNSTLFTTAPALASGRICGSPATPFSYTSTHASGCLTLRFTSDGSVNAAGWDATISCSPCAGGPSGTSDADCDFPTAICANSGNAGNSTGPGIDAEGCVGNSCPAGGENHSNWYTFTIQNSGTLEFDIIPTVGTDDYDFSLYGPGVGCGNLGSPIRCSDAGTIGNTGLATGNVDLTEDVTGNGYVAPLNVVAGEQYYLVVDEWTPTGAGYALNFTGTATMDCTVLPIEMVDFTVSYSEYEDVVDILWATKSESNNDYFTIEKSTDGSNYEEFRKVDGAGNSNTDITYIAIDPNPAIGTSYYRIKQTDFNGESRYSEVKAVYVQPNTEIFTVSPNPTNDIFTINYNCVSNTPASLNVYDYTGRIVISNELDCSEGENNASVDLSEYPEGMYLVVLSVNGRNYQTKVAKQL